MRPTILACIVAIATPALAQDTETQADWEIHRNLRRKAVMAYVIYDNGLSLAVRCIDEAYEAFVGGLPAPADRRLNTRTLGIAFGDAEMDMQRWNVGAENTMAVSDFPAPFARKLREGGRLQILVPDGGGPGRNVRYDVALPASTSSIDETLAACRRPLVDARDLELERLPEDGVPEGLIWTRAPEPDYPENPYARGFAAVSCATRPDGALQDCVIEAEHPRDGRFGDAVLRAVRRARVGWSGENSRPIPPRIVSFRSTFVISGYESREDREAERLQRERERRAREERARPAS